MKTLKFIALFLATLSLASCNDDDDVTIPSIDTSIEGSWKLVNVSGGMLPQNFDFAEGEITWTFNQETGKVVIVNNNTDESKPDYFESGTYNYVFMTTHVLGNPSLELFINETGMGTTVLQPQVLTLSHAASDGFTARLIR